MIRQVRLSQLLVDALTVQVDSSSFRLRDAGPLHSLHVAPGVARVHTFCANFYFCRQSEHHYAVVHVAA